MSHEHLVAGLVGGLTSTLFLHPLDLLKVRFAVSDGQSELKKSYKNISNALRTIVKEEGYRGLYKGVAPNCLGAGSAWGLYFLFYDAAKNKLQIPSALGNMTAAVFAGTLTTAITNPIWVVKTRLCLQYDNKNTLLDTKSQLRERKRALPESKRYSGTLDAFSKVYRHEGIKGLYKGFVPGLLNVSHGAIQLVVYEELKKLYLATTSTATNSTTSSSPNEERKLGPLQYLACAASSKLLAASITYPYQVVRARLQDQYVNYDGVLDVVKRTWRYESYRGFYKGFSAYVLHVTPNVCIVFFIYENVCRTLR